MFNKKQAPTRTIKRPHFRGNKAAMVAALNILKDHRYQIQVRQDMAVHVLEAACTVETVEVYEKVVDVKEAA